MKTLLLFFLFSFYPLKEPNIYTGWINAQPVEERVDFIEFNHFVSDETGHVVDQVILWEKGRVWPYLTYKEHLDNVRYNWFYHHWWKYGRMYNVIDYMVYPYGTYRNDKGEWLGGPLEIRFDKNYEPYFYQVDMLAKPRLYKRISSKNYRETWTTYDPEVQHRSLLPRSLRTPRVGRIVRSEWWRALVK